MANWRAIMPLCSRRNFLKTGLAAGVFAGTGGLPLRAARGTATDWVTLGESGGKGTRLAFGTGAGGGGAPGGVWRGTGGRARGGGGGDRRGWGPGGEAGGKGGGAPFGPGGGGGG